MSNRFKNHGLQNPQRKRIKIIEQSPEEIIADVLYFEEISDNAVQGSIFNAETMNAFDDQITASNTKAETANKKAETAISIANQAISRAEQAEEQIILKQGTKVLVNNEYKLEFNADEKADKTQLNDYLAKTGGEICGDLLIKKKLSNGTAFNVMNVQGGETADKNRMDVNGSIFTKNLNFSTNPGATSNVSQLYMDTDYSLKLVEKVDKNESGQLGSLSGNGLGYKTSTLSNVEGCFNVVKNASQTATYVQMKAKDSSGYPNASLSLDVNGNFFVNKATNQYNGQEFKLIEGTTGKIPSARYCDLISLISNNIENITSYYATWQFSIGGLKIIGGATPGSEGNKTVYFRMNNNTGTDVFNTVCLGLWSAGRYRTSATNNGWQYTYVESKGNGRIVQISNGSYWFAIGY